MYKETGREEDTGRCVPQGDEVLEHVGRAGRVREKTWTLPTVVGGGQPPRRGSLVLSAAGRAALAVAPHGAWSRHRQRPQRSGSGRRASAQRAAAPRQRQKREREHTQQPPPQRQSGAATADGRGQRKRTACRRARAPAPTGGASAANRQGRQRLAGEEAGRGRGTQRRGRCMATALPPLARRGACHRRGDRQGE